jgi:hypothetical protein
MFCDSLLNRETAIDTNLNALEALPDARHCLAGCSLQPKTWGNGHKWEKKRLLRHGRVETLACSCSTRHSLAPEALPSTPILLSLAYPAFSLAGCYRDKPLYCNAKQSSLSSDITIINTMAFPDLLNLESTSLRRKLPASSNDFPSFAPRPASSAPHSHEDHPIGTDLTKVSASTGHGRRRAWARGAHHVEG